MASQIKCPKCGEIFDAEHVMQHEIEVKVQQQFQEKWNNQQSMLADEKLKLETDRKNFEEKKNKENEIFKEKMIKEKVLMEKDLEEKIRQSLNDNYENKIKLLEKSNQDNESKLQQAREKELEFLKKENELKNKEAEFEITLQRKLQEERNSLAETIMLQEQAKNALKENEFQLKLKEMEKQLDTQKKLAEEMKRKAEQGSMQLQGEVQEEALENLLKALFPFDLIEEVAKGVKGADCIQTIRNTSGQICGKIIFESKRTETFSADWIPKLKNDMVSQNADIAVIVTKTMPKDMQLFGEKNGIYICNFREVGSLATVLRNAIIKIGETRKSQENKGEKMVSLYNYLTSQEFVGNWSAIRDGFKSLRGMLQKEREDFEKNWKKKEKQIELIIQNSLHISGSIEGISGQDTINMQLENNNENENFIDQPIPEH
jgi:hypothetical protein